MFKIDDTINQRYLLKQPLRTLNNGRQTWLAVDLGSHKFSLFWRWKKLNNVDWLNSLKLFFFRRSPSYQNLKMRSHYHNSLSDPVISIGTLIGSL